MAEVDGLKQTKIEKTGDRTFNVHTADGGHFECKSPVKLDRMKDVNHVRPENPAFSGVGEKRELVCDACGQKVSKLKGRFDRKSSKMIYACESCK